VNLKKKVGPLIFSLLEERIRYIISYCIATSYVCFCFYYICYIGFTNGEINLATALAIKPGMSSLVTSML